MTIRYSGRPTKTPANGEPRPARSIDTWSTSMNVRFTTDPDLLASVLPPPLTPPDEPVVKVGISTVDLGGGMPVIGAGTFAVAARHDGHDGFYPLLMPMTTEQAVVGGREIFGEPKKLAKIALSIDDDVLSATVSRMGVTIIEIDGRVGEDLAIPAEHEALDFYFKFLRDPGGGGLDADPWLVYCTRRGSIRVHRTVAGTLELRESKFDPVADFPVLSEPRMTLSERSSKQEGRLVQRVPAADVLPFVHQRYDDLMVAAGKGP